MAWAPASVRLSGDVRRQATRRGGEANPAEKPPELYAAGAFLRRAKGVLFAHAAGVEAAAVPQLQLGDNELLIFRGQRQLGLDLLGKQARKLLGLFPDFQQFVIFQRFHLIGERGIIFKGLTGTHAYILVLGGQKGLH